MSERRAELERAYHATTYAAAIPLRMRIGEPNPLLDAFLRQFDALELAYLSAYNPRSQRRCDEENRAAQQRLLDRLDGYETFVGYGESDDGSWPPEPSVLVVGLPREQAMALGREFEQHAIVVAKRGGAPELVWLD